MLWIVYANDFVLETSFFMIHVTLTLKLAVSSLFIPKCRTRGAIFKLLKTSRIVYELSCCREKKNEKVWWLSSLEFNRQVRRILPCRLQRPTLHHPQVILWYSWIIIVLVLVRICMSTSRKINHFDISFPFYNLL